MLVAGQRFERDAARGVATPEGGFLGAARRVNNSRELYRAMTYSVIKRYVFLFSLLSFVAVSHPIPSSSADLAYHPSTSFRFAGRRRMMEAEDHESTVQTQTYLCRVLAICMLLLFRDAICCSSVHVSIVIFLCNSCEIIAWAVWRVACGIWPMAMIKWNE